MSLFESDEERKQRQNNEAQERGSEDGWFESLDYDLTQRWLASDEQNASYDNGQRNPAPKEEDATGQRDRSSSSESSGWGCWSILGTIVVFTVVVPCVLDLLYAAYTSSSSTVRNTVSSPVVHTSSPELRSIAANVPRRLLELFKSSQLSNNRYLSYLSRSSAWLEGDFDGDHRIDYACYISGENASYPEMVVLFGDGKVRWPRREAKFPADNWSLIPKSGRIANSHWEKDKEAPKLLGDALLMSKPESSTAVLFWTGKRFESYYLSD
jgi:hypothetical protein